MVAAVCMGGRVAVRGVVAAPHVTAFEADPEVQPFRSHRKAVLAPVHGCRQFSDSNVIEMGAGGHGSLFMVTAGGTPVRAPVAEPSPLRLCLWRTCRHPRAGNVRRFPGERHRETL